MKHITPPMLLLFLFTADINADTIIVTAEGNSLTVDFESLDLAGSTELGDSTNIKLSYTPLSGSAHRPGSLDLFISENIGSSTPNYSYTIESPSVSHWSFMPAPLIDGSVDNSTQLWGDLNGAMAINRDSSETQFPSTIDIQVNLSGQQYSNSFLILSTIAPELTFLVPPSSGYSWSSFSSSSTPVTLNSPTVPLPAAGWLFICGILSLYGFMSRKRGRVAVEA